MAALAVAPFAFPGAKALSVAAKALVFILLQRWFVRGIAEGIKF